MKSHCFCHFENCAIRSGEVHGSVDVWQLVAVDGFGPSIHGQDTIACNQRTFQAVSL